MAEAVREHFNLYYIFLCDKRTHPPPEGNKERLQKLLFGQKDK